MNTLSPAMLAEIFKPESGDCFLTLLTISHISLPSPIHLVNNTEDVVSNSITYSKFPFRINLPADDGESPGEVSLVLDNVSLELIGALRTITDPLDVNLKMILGSIPDDIQLELTDLKIGSINYDAQTISGKLYQDNFMSSSMTSERYQPTNFPGLF